MNSDNRIQTQTLVFSFFWLAAALSAGPKAWAANNPLLDDSWRIYLGVFSANANSEIRVNGSAQPLNATKIQIEDVLGVEESKSVGWGGLEWRFADRHSIDMEIFALGRSASKSDSFAPPIQLGDVYLESGRIRTGYDTDVVRLTYNYSWRRTERAYLNTKIGVHWARLNAGFNLVGTVCSPNTTPSTPPGCPPQGTGTVSEDVSAPLLHLGASYTYALTETVALRLGAIGFALELDGIDGAIVELDADVAWQPFRHVGFGLGSRYFKTSVESRSSRLNGAFDFEYFGLAAFIQATF